jgi:hypothetical protein
MAVGETPPSTHQPVLRVRWLGYGNTVLHPQNKKMSNFVKNSGECVKVLTEGRWG